MAKADLYVEHIVKKEQSLEEAIDYQLRTNYHLYGQNGLLERAKELNPEITNWRSVPKGYILKIPYFDSATNPGLIVLLDRDDEPDNLPEYREVEIYRTLSETLAQEIVIDRALEFTVESAKRLYPDINWDLLPPGFRFILKLGSKAQELPEKVIRPATSARVEGKTNRLQVRLIWEPSEDASTQEIQVYKGAFCEEPIDSPVTKDAASDNHFYRFKKNGSYSFRVLTIVESENYPSECSGEIIIDAKEFKKPSQLRFEEGTLSQDLKVRPTWKPVLSKSVLTQKVTVYSGKNCETEVWQSHTLPRSERQVTFSAEKPGDYSFKVISFFEDDLQGASDCSKSIYVDEAVESFDL